MRIIAAALVAAVALLAAGCGGSSGPSSSADKTVYSFISALKHRNYGRACSYESEKFRAASPAVCSAGWFQAAAIGALMFGVENVYGDLYVVPGSKKIVDDDTVTYKVRDREAGGIPATLVEVGKQDSGNWRVVAIGAKPPKPDAK